MAQFMNQMNQSKCPVCGKPVLVKSVKGKRSVGYCSRVCASMGRYAQRYTGARAEIYGSPLNLERKRSE